MDKKFTRAWLLVILLIIIGGIILGGIARYFQPTSPAYSTNASQQCGVITVVLPTAPSFMVNQANDAH